MNAMPSLMPKVLASSATFTSAFARYAQLLQEAKAVVPPTHGEYGRILAALDQLMAYHQEYTSASAGGDLSFARLKQQVEAEITRLAFRRESTGLALLSTPVSQPDSAGQPRPTKVRKTAPKPKSA